MNLNSNGVHQSRFARSGEVDLVRSLPIRSEQKHKYERTDPSHRTTVETIRKGVRYVQRRVSERAIRLQNCVTRRPLKSTPDLSNKNLLFLTGLHRSGTSVVHRLLRSLDGVTGFANTGHTEDEGQFLQSVVPMGMTFGGPGKFAFDPDAHLTEHSELANNDSREKILREWGAYWDLSQQVMLEKSPPTIVRTRFFQSLFPEASFIVIVRHPIPVSMATEKWSETSLTELLLHWHVSHQRLIDDLPYLKNVLLFRYEDFVRAPAETLAHSASLVNMRFGQLNEPIVDRNCAYFDRWESSRSCDIEILERTLNHQRSPLRMFGYSLTKPFTVKPESASVLTA
jgi:hypothetical protein